MLAECRKKIATLGAPERVAIVQGDVLEHPFTTGAFDSALIGFLISHVTEEQEATLRRVLGLLVEWVEKEQPENAYRINAA